MLFHQMLPAKANECNSVQNMGHNLMVVGRAPDAVVQNLASNKPLCGTICKVNCETGSPYLR